MQEFTPACTIKKVIKNKPVSPMANFFPIEAVKKDFQVITKQLVYLMLQKYVRNIHKIIFISFFNKQKIMVNNSNKLYRN
jgi:hypothetical protein